jgi:glycosyltransferase involved in cell wall biosynthesis
MNILFFTKGDKTVPSSRYRVWFVAERLQKQYGWQYEIIHSVGYALFSVSLRRFWFLRRLCYSLLVTRYSLLFIHKSLFPWDVVLLIIMAKKLFGKNLVYDLDDAEWIHSPRKSAFLARHADMVVCGSHEILRWAENHNKRCVLIPTALDAELFMPYAVLHKKREIITIGWTGQGKSHYKAGNFFLLKKAFRLLSERGAIFRFVIVGSQDYQPLKDLFSSERYEVCFIDSADWEKEDAVPKLIKRYSFDIGVMPIVDTPFNRAKCAFKALEYMACGVPVVASPVGEANYIITENKNGFLADSPAEWAHVMEYLSYDATLRAKLGRNGQAFVYQQYSFRSMLPRIHDAYEAVNRKL